MTVVNEKDYGGNPLQLPTVVLIAPFHLALEMRRGTDRPRFLINLTENHGHQDLPQHYSAKVLEPRRSLTIGR